MDTTADDSRGVSRRTVIGRLFHKFLRLALAVGLVAAAFAGDYATGSEISSSLFYVFAITVGSWVLGRRAGLLMAPLSTGAWALAYLLVGKSFSKPAILYSNLAVEFGIYIAMAMSVSGARASLDHERRLTARLDQANQALDREAHAVADLQRELLPRATPSVTGYEWETYYAPSARAGGDYYDFFPIDDGRIGILLADASGHGAPAAVLMAMTRVLLRAAADRLDHPECVLARLNNQLARTLPEGWFVTAVYAVLDPARGSVQYALAGHDPPFLVRAGAGTPCRLEDCAGLPLGLFADSRYGSGSVLLEPGDTLALYTDGLTDALSPGQDLFGEQRLCAALEEGRSLSLRQMREQLLHRVHAHADGTPFPDDVTMLLVRRVSVASME